MLDDDFPPSFALALAAKDARLVGEAAERHGADLPIARAIAERFAEATEAGHGDEDMAVVYRLAARAERYGAAPARSTAASRAVRASSPVIPEPRSRSIAVERTWPMMTLIERPGSSCSSRVAFTAASSASRRAAVSLLGVLELVAELEHGVAEQRDGVGQLGGAGPWRRIALSARRASTRVLRTA